jgi:rubrerythrin
MKSLKGTQTEKNLLISFAGESQARMRYTMFASEAKKAGFEQIAAIFLETADQEKEHAKRLFKFLEGGEVEVTASFPAGIVGTTLENLIHAFDSKNKIVTDFSLKTLPEKCVWSQKSKNIVYCAVPQNLPQADYPDAWYQGAVSFQDQIWRLDAATGDVKLMSTLFEANDFIDATNPILDPTETYLLFTNKNDFQLWGLTLI